MGIIAAVYIYFLTVVLFVVGIVQWPSENDDQIAARIVELIKFNLSCRTFLCLYVVLHNNMSRPEF